MSTRINVKSLTRYHHDMESYRATSDVKSTQGDTDSPPCVGLTSNTFPKAKAHRAESPSDIGVSTHYAPKSSCSADTHWYALRTTYGREHKAYEYLKAHGVDAFYPTLKSIKMVDGKRITIETSRIPNIFFARGTEEEIQSYVYDNVNLPYLRFYYRHTHVGRTIAKVPLVVPDSQMHSLMIICQADADDVIATAEAVAKFKEGEKVRITDGKFKGVVGVVGRFHSQQRVGVVIDGLLTVCTAYVPSGFLLNIDSLQKNKKD